jgi:four helix bundle protein
MMIKTYKDLEAYKESYQLFLQVHKMAIRYPDYERYEMGAQIRRAAMSIPMNIAEGYGKKSSELEFKRFLTMSLGSCNEVQVLPEMSKDLEYITKQEYEETTRKYEILGKRLNTLISKWKSNI